MNTTKNSPSIEGKQVEKDTPLRVFNIVAVFLTLVILIFLVLAISPKVFSPNNGGVGNLPVSIRAGSEADYSHDSPGTVIPQISDDILNQIIMDIPATGSPKERTAKLQDVLSIPVPTMTLIHNLRVTFTPALIFPNSTPTAITPIPTSSQVSFFTPTLPYIPITTATPSPPPNNIPTVYLSPVPTLIYPSSTFTLQAFTATFTLMPTATIPASIPTTITPTNQLIPTNTTAAPIPTDTPQPVNTQKPSNTPRPTNTHRPTKAN